MLADIMWERAVKLAETIAPEVPTDAEPLDEYEQYLILERTSLLLSPGYWEDPDALDDLYRLRKKYQEFDDENLKQRARQARSMKESLPDPAISPANPEFEKRMRKLQG